MSSKANPWGEKKNPLDNPVAHGLLTIVLKLKVLITNSEGREEKRRKYDPEIEDIFKEVDELITKHSKE